MSSSRSAESASAARPTVAFASAALIGLGPAAAHSLAAHELADVIRGEHNSAAGRYVWLAGYPEMMGTGTGLSVHDDNSTAAWRPGADGHRSRVPGPPGRFRSARATTADLFAVELAHDLDAAAELMRFSDEHGTGPLPNGRLARALTRPGRRLLATRSPAPARLAAMRRHLAERPGRERRRVPRHR